MSMRQTVLAALSVITLIAAAPLAAQTYPGKPIRMVTPFPPAGSLDVVGRSVVNRLSVSLGQTVILENRPGAGGVIGSESVARSAPDGYTLLLSSASTHSIAPALQPKLPYDPIKDFTPIIEITPGGATVLMVAINAPWKSAGEMIAFARANPEKVSFGTGGVGTVPHLTTSALAAHTGTQFLHVPYKGAALVMPDLIAGRVSFMFDSIISAQPHVNGGKVRALGVSGGKRSPLLPEVPSFPESGLPGFEPPGAYMGVWGPAGLPSLIVARLNMDLNRMLQSQDMKEQMAKLGIEATGGTPEAFGEHVRADRGRWAEVVAKTGLKVD
ncbi:MAG: Bug family tripartite tricarboxylate transporter substrate binding protein [Burkholderiales bacterium]